MTTPYYTDERAVLHHGDCLDVLAAMPDASVDAIVTDPPYSLMPREVDAGGLVCWGAQVKTAPAANRGLTAKTVRSLDGWS